MTDIVLIIILSMISILVVSVLYMKDLLSVIIATGLISVLSAILYTLVDALDVAFTEAAVGAAVSSTLFLAITHLTKSYNYSSPINDTRYRHKFITKVIYILLFCLLAYVFLESIFYMPIYGSIDAPANNVIYKTYVETSYNEFKVPNIVTMVLGSFRGYDTLGETTVVLIAALGVYSILKEFSNKEDISIKEHKIKKDTIKGFALLFLVPIVLLYGFYVQFHGDFGPGGGFQAGVIISSIYILITLMFKRSYANKYININILLYLLSFGVFIYVATGFVSMILGGKFLDYSVFGDRSHAYHYGLFAIELGVGITVFAAMSTIISKFYAKIKE